MISNVNGTVLAIGDDRIDVSLGPIALTVQVPGTVAHTAQLGQNIVLSTTMIVREDAITLYGFSDAVSRDDFLILLSVSGIGPRLALAIVATLPPAALRAAISGGNVATLTSVSGVGKKSAERMVIELRDRLPHIPTQSGASPAVPAQWQEQVRTALHGLGWNPRDAQAAVEQVAQETFADGAAVADQPLQSLLRAALRSLDRS